jgi:5-formyltetrahydrofolate cyclo-ligase
MTQTAGDAGSEKRKHRERREVHRGCDAGKDQIRKWSLQSHQGEKWCSRLERRQPVQLWGGTPQHHANIVKSLLHPTTTQDVPLPFRFQLPDIRFQTITMTGPASSDSRRKLLWARVYQDLIRHAIPDSRSNFDFLSFTPDFRHSEAASSSLVGLECYQSARTLLITSDNSLEALRYQALRDGKKVLVGTFRLRRGFVLLDPSRIDAEKLVLAACLDGMEKPGIGRSMSIAQIRDEGLKIDLCATGGLVFNQRGVVVYEGSALFEVQWALLHDICVLDASTRVVALAHTCQVVDEASLGVEEIKPGGNGEIQCDYVVTPEQIFEIKDAVKSEIGINFDAVDPDALDNIPPLQELKGIRMMEQIMAKSGFGQEQAKAKEAPKAPSAEEQMGIDMVERLMKGYKA